MAKKQELELAYLRAMNEWMIEESKTKQLAMEQHPTGKFADQLQVENAAYERYKAAQRAYVKEPWA
ncbi:MAG: hypothetical protein HY820_03145 [Acidobacteria bacterium]|nr:hypothetical protein [Acidobacteriota bacterium]